MFLSGIQVGRRWEARRTVYRPHIQPRRWGTASHYSPRSKKSGELKESASYSNCQREPTTMKEAEKTASRSVWSVWWTLYVETPSGVCHACTCSTWTAWTSGWWAASRVPAAGGWCLNASLTRWIEPGVLVWFPANHTIFRLGSFVTEPSLGLGINTKHKGFLKRPRCSSRHLSENQ